MPNPVQPTFPLATPGDRELTVASENAFTTLVGVITANQTEMTVASTAGFDVPGILAVENELILALDKNPAQFTGLVRGFAGSTASSHTGGVEVNALYVAYHHNKLAAEITSLGGWVFRRDLSGLQPHENMIPWSEAIEQPVWSKLQGATVTGFVSAAPDGSLSARTVTDGNGFGVQGVAVTPIGLNIGTSYIWSVYAKALDTPWVVIGQDVQGDITRCAWFNLADGVVGTVGSLARAAIVPVGNGWFRLIVVAPSTAGGNINFEIAATTANGVKTYSATASKSTLVWGAMVRSGDLDSPLPYIKTQGATVTGTVNTGLVLDEGEMV